MVVDGKRIRTGDMVKRKINKVEGNGWTKREGIWRGRKEWQLR